MLLSVLLGISRASLGAAIASRAGLRSNSARGVSADGEIFAG